MDGGVGDQLFTVDLCARYVTPNAPARQCNSPTALRVIFLIIRIDTIFVIIVQISKSLLGASLVAIFQLCVCAHAYNSIDKYSIYAHILVVQHILAGVSIGSRQT